jgi:hypothetical protein
MFESNNKIYKDLPNTFIKEDISNLQIVFNPNWKNIAVNLSGGADSALLTYLLCHIIKKHNLTTKVNVITYQRCWTTRPWQGWWSVQVLNKLKEYFPDIINERITTYIPPELEYGESGPIIDGRSGDQIIVGSFNKFAAWEYNLDAVFNATSKNPENDNREDRMDNRDGDAEDAKLEDLWAHRKGLDTVFAHPFRFVQKDWIVAQYHIFDILDLYKQTRSCEGDIELDSELKQIVGSFGDYKPGMHVPTCGRCWWCYEREWAESRVDQIIEEINNV